MNVDEVQEMFSRKMRFVDVMAHYGVCKNTLRRFVRQNKILREDKRNKIKDVEELVALIEAGTKSDVLCKKYGFNRRLNLASACDRLGVQRPHDYQQRLHIPVILQDAPRVYPILREDERRIIVERPVTNQTYSGASQVMCKISLPRIKCIHGEFRP